MNFSISKQTFQYIVNAPLCLSLNKLNFKYRVTTDYSLGFVLPRSLGMANKRNQFKRRCRSIVRNLFSKDKIPTIGLIVAPKKLDITYKELCKSFELLSDNIIENI